MDQQQPDLWLFFDDIQKQIVKSEVNIIAANLLLPVPLHQIFRVMQDRKAPTQIKHIDPRGDTIVSKLIQTNTHAVSELFRKIASNLSDIIEQTLPRYEEEHTIQYIGRDYLALVNKQCRSTQFQWRVRVPRNGSLWQRLHDQVSRLLKDTLCFMVKHYELSIFESEKQLEIVMQKFRDRMISCRKHLQNLHPLGQHVMKSLIRVEKQQMKNIPAAKTSEMVKVISKIEEMELEIEEEQAIQAINNKKKQGNTFFGFLTETKNLIAGKFEGMFTKDQQTPTKQQTQADINNLQKLVKLTQTQKQIVDSLTYQKIDNLFQRIAGKFTLTQMDKLQYTLKIPLTQWESEETFVIGQGLLVQSNRMQIYKLRDYLINTLKRIEPGNKQDKQRYFALTAILYRSIQASYCTLAKRYLMRVCETIQSVFTNPQCPYIRGALRLFEATSIRPSQLAVRLQNQMPYRSPNFKESQTSRISRESTFTNRYSTPNANIQSDDLQNDQLLRFQRLSYAQPSKNVTFLISGFLSQNTEKDLQWLGVIRALQDGELYGVIWRSSTRFDLIKYIGVAAGTLALKGIKAKSGNPIALAEVAQYAVKIAGIFLKQEDRKDDNPFWGSLTRATDTGYYLADQLIQHFSDRFITLVGFSMGTEVIRACIERLVQRKRQDLLLKVVTLGGVVDRDMVGKLLHKCREPLSWINFSSKNDHAVRYVYRVCTLGSKPAGSAGIIQAIGHEVINWEVGEVVKGHMDFRTHLFGLCLMAGLRHD